MADYVFAGDIGGTKADLAIFSYEDERLQPIFEKVYHSTAVGSATELLECFLEEAPSVAIASACFGFAGPVRHGKSKAVNLAWEMDQGVLQKTFGFDRLVLLNDLAALSYAIPHFKKEQLLQLKDGFATDGSIGLLAAGTGLGEALLYRQGNQILACPSEGGHKDFSPRTEQEFKLLQFLQKKYDHVSTERVLSGAGIVDIFLFLLEEERLPIPEWLPTENIHKHADLITNRAMGNHDRLSIKALHIFSSLYGAEAGNIALQYLATGGIYIGGGIGPKIETFLDSDQFRTSFTAKGRFQELLEKIPVFLIRDNRGTLQGAAWYATTLVSGAKT
ncbi:MAG: glucokinase [Deltaproteobacteria bacterium]